MEFKTLFLKAANGEKKAAGVTFIELMIAMMLFTLLMWPLYQIFQWSANSTMKTGDLTIAANVASELIELLKNKPFDVLSRLDPKSGLKAKMDEKDIQDFLGKTFDDKFS
ncbi:MAG TPA: prepilin-type N-terminal cleavage/methylation domain-containing protein, partial [Candidatus Wallbacteria bacterium]|nr:prepilin-type N-terminal cleavage/methylation domain-containing protein [Candidatus Wallbacteria bacterium]